MNNSPLLPPGHNRIARRDLIKGLLATTAAATLPTAKITAQSNRTIDTRKTAPVRYPMKKSINQWAFPYPDRMNLRECFQLAKDAGFDGIELNYDLQNDLSPHATKRDYRRIRQMADDIGIEISGLCSFLFWPYPLTSNDETKRNQGIDLAGKIAAAASELGVKNVLLVPGAVHIPWRDDHEPVPNDVCDRRARQAVGKLAPQAEKLGVYLNIENIFFNGYLMTPMEMNAFVDSFQSEHVKIHFDTGNISMFQNPEHWVPIMGKRTQNIHFKEFTKKGTDFSLETFRPLLDGTTNWPAVMEELNKISYQGYLTFEYFHPYPHYPEALIYQTSDSLDRIMGRKSNA
ncbi:MAG: sugar phosphate isomerase/epimerase [Verrucomicrobia bacterium]|jgi:L-ribulose-5-phosphate 3-epimerase|nr:sugar phosphate isomerase/epimerase [Verrucomicrobiota bacterium]MDA7510640.1 sugar phosphate isomerase/epimerase [Verrucomicrobiota bacterium]